MSMHLTARIACVAATAILASACGQIDGALDAMRHRGNDFTQQGAVAIARASFKEMRKTESVRLLGTMDTDEGPTRVDLRLDETSCVGDFDTNAGGFQLIKNGEGAWFKADKQFWRSQSASPQVAAVLIKKVGTRWVTFGAVKDIEKACDLGALLEAFEMKKDDSEETLEKGEIETIGDLEAIAVTGGRGKDRTTAWIAIEAPHRVLKLAPARPGAGQEAVFFEEFGTDVDAVTPKKDEIVSLPSLSR